MHTLQGYVEWHIANTIQMIVLANNVQKMDIILGGGAALSLIAGNQCTVNPILYALS
jgi:hypothetical protein